MQGTIDQMSRIGNDVRRRMEQAVEDVITICRKWGYLGKDFTFSANPETEREVNAILTSFSDDILSDVEHRAAIAMEEEDDDAIAWMYRSINGEDAAERIGRHSSTLKYFLEGWLAIGFTKGLSDASILNSFFSYVSNPYASPMWQDAMSDTGYRAASIRSRGYSYGRGNQRNTLNAIISLLQTMINMAYQKHVLKDYRKKGAVGYRTRRNSKWDCELCDEVASVIHPLTDVVLPVHPRCVCSSYPVYMDEAYPEDMWEHTYRNARSGGYVVTDTDRIKASLKSPNEKEKYAKERRMAIVLADNGYRIEHLAETPGKSSCDVTINGVPADLKSIKSHNNIVKRYKKAVNQQGAQAVIFEFPEETDAIYNELFKSFNGNVPIYYYFEDKKKVYVIK